MLFEGPVPVRKLNGEEPAAERAAGSTMRRNEVSVVGEVDAARPQTLLHLSSGATVTVPTEWLLGGLPTASATTPAIATAEETEPQAAMAEGRQGVVVPVIEEVAEVGKRTVTKGTVRLHKGTETFTEQVSLPLTQTGWDVQRVAVGQLLTERPEVRQEGEVTVFPLVEERLVARREYFLLEEVRVRRLEETTERTARVELKRDVLTVDREGAVEGKGS